MLSELDGQNTRKWSLCVYKPFKTQTKKKEEEIIQQDLPMELQTGIMKSSESSAADLSG